MLLNCQYLSSTHLAQKYNGGLVVSGVELEASLVIIKY